MFDFYRERRNYLREQLKFAEEQIKALEKICSVDSLQHEAQSSYMTVKGLQFETLVRLTVYAHSVISRRQNQADTHIHLRDTLSGIADDKTRQTNKYSLLWLEIYESEVKHALKLLEEKTNCLKSLKIDATG